MGANQKAAANSHLTQPSLEAGLLRTSRAVRQSPEPEWQIVDVGQLAVVQVWRIRLGTSLPCSRVRRLVPYWVRGVRKMSRTIQAASDAMNAGIQATNDMNAAAAQQMQLDQNLAIMPLQQN